MRLDITLSVESRLGDPHIKIIIDDYLTLVDGPAQECYNFNIQLLEEHHDLKIIHYGKTVEDHVMSEDGTIAIDKHVEIKSIVMDDNVLVEELWSGKFYPVYMHKAADEPYFISPNLYLGHNGTWIMEFACPVAQWLINLRKPGPKYMASIFKTNQDILDSAKDYFRDLPDV